MNPPRHVPDREDEFEDKPLNGSESAKVRRVLRDYERMLWFVKIMLTGARWFTGAIISGALAYTALTNIFNNRPPK